MTTAVLNIHTFTTTDINYNECCCKNCLFVAFQQDVAGITGGFLRITNTYTCM